MNLEPDKMFTGNKRLLPIEVVAACCGVSRRTAYRWIDREGLPVHRIPGAGCRPILRISQADLDAWLGQHRYDPNQAADDGRTVRLEGRHFINAGDSLDDDENNLDPVPTGRSRVTGDCIKGKSP